MNNNEYLYKKQAAFLLQINKSMIENYIEQGYIKTELNRGRQMIKVEDLKEYVWKQLNQYSLVEQYFAAGNKRYFWKIQKRTFHHSRYTPEELNSEYLSLQQCAYLLHKSPGQIRFSIDKGTLLAKKVTAGKRVICFIRSDDLFQYVEEEKNKYSRVMEYLFCPDTFVFWENHKEDFEREGKQYYKRISS